MKIEIDLSPPAVGDALTSNPLQRRPEEVPVSDPLLDPTDAKPRKRRTRDFSRAEWLRPRDVFEIYGVPQPTSFRWCAVGMVKSVKFGGKKGRKGVRLINKASIDALIEQRIREGKL